MDERDKDLCVTALLGGALDFLTGYVLRKTSFYGMGEGLRYELLADEWKPSAIPVSLPESFGVPYESKPVLPKKDWNPAFHVPPPLQPWLPPPTKPQPVVPPEPDNIVQKPELPAESLPEDEIDVERFRRIG